MNTNRTEIAFVLDRSGSMSAMHAGAVEGFNHFLADQQADEASVRLSLVLFDHEYAPAFESVPVSELAPMSMDDFQPRGSTALLDALGRTIDELGERLKAMPGSERPGHVIVATLTDGMENASQTFDLTAVQRRISHQEKKYGWEFVFLSSDLKAIDFAGTMGIAKSRTLFYPGSEDGVKEGIADSATLIREMKERRRGK